MAKTGFNVTIGADTKPFETALRNLNTIIKTSQNDLKRLNDGLKLNPTNTKILETQFLEQRDFLETRYHKVIEANIRREKDHKNDLRKIRLKNAIFADKARAKGSNRSMTTHNISLKLEDMDEIHDRIPILDLLINKWSKEYK